MVGIKKKDKLTPEQLEEMNEYMEKLLEENQVVGERCKDFLDNVRKNLLPEKKLDHALIIIHEAIADTLKDNLYPQSEEKISIH